VTGWDIIVIGLGAMGSATLQTLARRGVRVLGIEQFQPGHGQGSSGGDTRLIRQAYFEHPDYVPLLKRAYALWRQLEAESGRSLLFETGTLYIGQPDSELIAGSRLAAAVHGIDLACLDDGALAARFPAFRLPPGYVAVWEPDAGFLLCERAIHVNVDLARGCGATVHDGETVLGWTASSDGVVVETDHDRYVGGALVVAGGSWSDRLLASLRLPLTVTRQPLFWVDPGASGSAHHDLGAGPCWAVQRPDRPGLFYGFPRLPGRFGMTAGIKLAHHAPGEPADPRAPRRGAERAELNAVLDAVRPFLPGITGPQRGERVCLYTLSPDGHFIIDRHPQHDNVVYACGFSGHGFKFAPVVGEALADLALVGHTDLPVAFLRRRLPA
jgi:sarcosine oxidase